MALKMPQKLGKLRNLWLEDGQRYALRRDEVFLNTPVFGRKAAERMLAREIGFSTTKLSHNRRVRAILAELSIHGDTLDLTPFINSLSDEDAWELVSSPSCQAKKSLIAQRWRSPRESVVRSLSLGLGRNLESLDLSESGVTDDSIQGFMVRLFELKRISLSHADKISNAGVATIANAASATLNYIDVSHCELLTGEALGWLSGALGAGRQGCAKLTTLSFEGCRKILDDGLAYLGKGCKNLRFVNMANTRVSETGVKALVSGCRKLRIINLQNNDIGDAAVVAIAKNCTALRSLNVGKCTKVTDAAVTSLGRQCRRLEALNIAGAVACTEKALYFLARNCLQLHTLNVTGCVHVSVRGLRAMMTVLESDNLVEAQSFFGFLPSSKDDRQKLWRFQRDLEEKSARRIQRLVRRCIQIMRRKSRRAEMQKNAAASKIGTALRRAKHRRLMDGKKRGRREHVCAATIQRVFRGWRGRKVAGLRRVDLEKFLRKSDFAFRIQTRYRAYRVRGGGGKWARASLELERDKSREKLKRHRNESIDSEFEDRATATMIPTAKYLLDRACRRRWRRRHSEFLEAVAVRLTSFARFFLGKCRAWHLREKLRKWHEKRFIAARRIQQRQRYLRAQNIAEQRRFERSVRMFRERRSARILKRWWGILHGKAASEMSAVEQARLHRVKVAAVQKMQRVYKGFLGREAMRARRWEFRMETAAATKIQAAFRSSRILFWRHIHLNKTATFVFRRRELEIFAREDDVQSFLEERRERHERDSASESDDEEDAVEAGWEERYDEQSGSVYWYNSSTGESRSTNAGADLDKELVDRYVRIFWPLQQQWYEGVVTAYNSRKRRHRVDYDDGDHEWINLGEERSRVQVYNGVAWVDFELFETPAMLEEKVRARELKLRKDRTQAIFTERESWKPLAPMLREGKNIVRWVHNDTGEMKFGIEDFEEWEEDVDSDNVLFWRHRDTGALVAVPEDDPRWDSSGGDPRAQARRRMAVLGDLRYYGYVVRGLVQRAVENRDRYESLKNAAEHGGDTKPLPNAERDFREAVDAIRDNASLKALLATLTGAREEWTEQEMAEHDELVHARDLLEAAQQVETFALQMHWERQENRRHMFSDRKNTS